MDYHHLLEATGTVASGDDLLAQAAPHEIKSTTRPRDGRG